MNIETEKKITFPCTCGPCRGIFPGVAHITYPQQLNTVTQGHYFAPSTMRFFNSRVGSWRILSNPASEESRRDGLAVVVSSRGDFVGAAREYELIRICAYGAIQRDYDVAHAGLVKYDSSRAANKALAAAVYPSGCDCHGCVLDRQGR